MTLLDDLGGPVALARSVDELYDRLLADPRVSGTFEGHDVPAIRVHMVDFLAAAAGGPDTYDGRDLADAHARLAVTDEMFDVVVAHLADVLTTEVGDAGAVTAMLANLGPLRGSVVTR